MKYVRLFLDTLDNPFSAEIDVVSCQSALLALADIAPRYGNIGIACDENSIICTIAKERLSLGGIDPSLYINSSQFNECVAAIVIGGNSKTEKDIKAFRDENPAVSIIAVGMTGGLAHMLAAKDTEAANTLEFIGFFMDRLNCRPTTVATANYKYSYLGTAPNLEAEVIQHRSPETVDLDGKVTSLVAQFYENFSVVHNLSNSNKIEIRIDTPGVDPDRTGPYIEITDQQGMKACNLTFEADRLTNILETEFEGPSKETTETTGYQAAMQPVRDIMGANLLPCGTHIFGVRLG